MPNRILRDGINTSYAVNALSEQAEILYRRLMSVVDDYGRFSADENLIRAACFPLQFQRWTTVKIRESLLELGESPLITVYHGGNKKYLQINNFGQRIQSKAKYPGPDSPGFTVGHGDPPLNSESESESDTNSESSAESESARTPPPPLTAGDMQYEDPREVIDALIPRHWALSNRARAISALEAQIQSAVNPQGVLEAIRRNHALHAEFHKSHPKVKRKPALEHWIYDGDYMHPPPDSDARGSDLPVSAEGW